MEAKKALDKENVSDFPDNHVKVKDIIRNLGQTRYIVEGTTIPVLRSDLWLHKPGERKDTTPLKGEAYKAPEPFMSWKRVGIRIREHNKAKREEKRVAQVKVAAKDKAKAEKKETRLKTKEMVMAAKVRGAKARAEAATKRDEELRESLRTRIARLDWRGRPIYR